MWRTSSSSLHMGAGEGSSCHAASAPGLQSCRQNYMLPPMNQDWAPPARGRCTRRQTCCSCNQRWDSRKSAAAGAVTKPSPASGLCPTTFHKPCLARWASGTKEVAAEKQLRSVHFHTSLQAPAKMSASQKGTGGTNSPR